MGHRLRSAARQARQNEVIGGGWLVLRRGRSTGRLSIPPLPFEHGSPIAALQSRRRLRRKEPDELYEIWKRVTDITP